jgi:threonine dehydratase
MREKRIVPSVHPITIADGLLTSLGTLTFQAISQHVDKILTVTEEGIRKAMRLIWERMKIVAEPSACVPLAAILEHNDYFNNKKVAVIISGGNVEPKTFL